MSKVEKPQKPTSTVQQPTSQYIQNGGGANGTITKIKITDIKTTIISDKKK